MTPFQKNNGRPNNTFCPIHSAHILLSLWSQLRFDKFQINKYYTVHVLLHITQILHITQEHTCTFMSTHVYLLGLLYTYLHTIDDWIKRSKIFYCLTQGDWCYTMDINERKNSSLKIKISRIFHILYLTWLVWKFDIDVIPKKALPYVTLTNSALYMISSGVVCVRKH